MPYHGFNCRNVVKNCGFDSKRGVLQDPPPLGLKRIKYTLGPVGLRHQRRNKPCKIKETLKNIISETDSKLPKDIMDLMIKIFGQNWPDNIQARIEFNTGGCTLAFSNQPNKQPHD